MTTILKDDYVGRVDLTDPNYPWGKGLNRLGGIPNTGTPFDEKWFNDFEGNKQAYLRLAGIVPSGNPDNAVESDQLEAIKRISNAFLVGNPAGSFRYGFDFTSANDVGIANDGTFWKYSGTDPYPVTVAENTDPTTGDFTQAFARDGQPNPVGNFSDVDGVTFNFPNDVARDSNGEYWSWTGSLPYTAAQNTVPSEPTYSKRLANVAENISNDDGSTAQDTYDALKATLVAQGLSGNFGFFAKGFTFNEVGDVGIDADGKIYTYAGSDPLPVGVSAGTDPVGDSDYQVVNFNLEPFKTVNAMRAYNYSTIPADSRIVWQGYYAQSDGGSNWGVLKKGDSTSLIDDGGSIFIIVNDAVNGVWVEANLKGKSANIRKFGAIPDSTQSTLVTDNSGYINALINYLSLHGGGRVYIPSPLEADKVYGISTDDENLACIRVTSDGISISGDGETSILQTYNNKHVPIHVCRDQDLTNPRPVGEVLTGFEFKGAHVRGTGIYENFGLAFGRGILFRNAKKVDIHDGWVSDMSMIGVCAEGGDGYFNTRNMQLHGNRYTAVNYNGRCYQSVVHGCVVSGCNGDVNSLAIQVTGHSTVSNCTVFGEIGNEVNCGGISWGEGNYDGIGSITGCLVKNTSFGILSVYHGSCNISGNTVINALTRDGIIMSGSATPNFTVANSNNICANNLIINCRPSGISCSAAGTLITGNKIRNFTPVTNPSANTEPDYIASTTTEQGIRVRAPDCSVHGNFVSGCTHGLTTTILQRNGIIGKNTLINNTHDYSLESETSSVIAVFGHAVIERELASSELYRERIFKASLPSQGFFEKGSQWDDPTPSIGSPFGQRVLFTNKTSVVDANAAESETVITLNNVTGILGTGVGSIVGIELDNGAWHWSEVSSVSSPTITLSSAIPAGRSTSIGNRIAYCYFRPLANIT